MYESETPTSTHVSHALARGGSVVMRRVVTSGREVAKGIGEVRCWPSKSERNRSSLDQIGSKTPKAIRTKENVTTE
jgi:hypothetical protein